MKTKTKSRLLFVFILLIIYNVWSSYFVQATVAPLYGFLFREKAWQVSHVVAQTMPSWVLIRKLSDGNFYLGRSALKELCQRENNPRHFDRVKRLTEHKEYDVRNRAFLALKCFDQAKANDFYMSSLQKYPVDSMEYRISLYLLIKTKSENLLPHIKVYFKNSLNWNAVGRYLKVYGDPRVLPLLYEIKEKSKLKENKMHVSKNALKEIDEAIEELEKINR